MSNRKKELIGFISFILMLLFLLLTLLGTNQEKNLTIVLKEGSILQKALIIGDPKKPIINPRSVSTSVLMENNEYYQKSLKAKNAGLLGKSDIYFQWAKETVMKQIKTYAQTNNIGFIFEEGPFFKFLRTKLDFANKTNKELREEFDLTDAIIKSVRQEKAKAAKKQ